MGPTVGNFSEDKYVPPQHPRPKGLTLRGAAFTAAELTATAAGYGSDPNMVTPRTPWPDTLSADERALVEALADTILPAIGAEPAPSRVGIARFFGEWLSAPYPRQVEDRTLFISGRDLLEAECQTRFSLPFAALSASQRVGMVDWLFRSGAETRRFFVRFRYLLVGGYYTTDVGMGLLGYRGNVPLAAFPPVTAEAQAIIGEQLALLGLA
jgi:hypothetical protein